VYADPSARQPREHYVLHYLTLAKTELDGALEALEAQPGTKGAAADTSLRLAIADGLLARNKVGAEIRSIQQRQQTNEIICEWWDIFIGSFLFSFSTFLKWPLTQCKEWRPFFPPGMTWIFVGTRHVSWCLPAANLKPAAAGSGLSASIVHLYTELFLQIFWLFINSSHAGIEIRANSYSSNLLYCSIAVLKKES
jgi:hypothetical protein